MKVKALLRGKLAAAITAAPTISLTGHLKDPSNYTAPGNVPHPNGTSSISGRT